MHARKLLACAVALGCATLAATPAHGATVISPADGDTVSAHPTFAFDFLNGVAEIELSRSSDTLTAGSDQGGFVDTAYTQFSVLYVRSPLDGLAPWTGRPIDAGRYYWHVKTRDDGADTGSGAETPWQPTKTLDVLDEPAVFEGWTLQTQRLARQGTCTRRLRLSGKIAWSDNGPGFNMDYSIRLTAGGRTIANVRGNLSTTYANVVCLKTTATKIMAAPFLRDQGDHVTRGTSRTIRVAS
jgi:hypothetical protein